MGIFDFIFSLIVLTMLGSLGVTLVAGHLAWKGGKRLIGWIRDQKRLPGTTQNPSREAQDVVVEPVEDQPAPQQSVKRHDYVRLDVDRGSTPADITRVMRGYTGDPVVGEYARGVIDTLESVELRRQSIFAEIDGTFQHGSISWDKFAAPAQAGIASILRNSALLANRIQSFDTSRYLRLKREEDRVGSRASDEVNASHADRLKHFEETLASFDTIQETNDNLLMELDKLTVELSSISGSETSSKSDYIIEEIHRLVEEAKYYR